MAWKRKERDLTSEEAIALAKKELTPYWFGSPPLFGGVKRGNTVQVFPLNPSFSEKTWVILFCDAYGFSGESIQNVANEWHRRFNDLGLKFLVVLTSTIPVETKNRITAKITEKNPTPYPLVVDHDLTLAQAFQLKHPIKLLLFKNGKPIFSRESSEIDFDLFKSLELELHKFLRQMDPGLPLLRPITSKGVHVLPTSTVIDLCAGKFDPQKYKLGGSWRAEKNSVMTSDPAATLSFKGNYERVALVAKCLAQGKIIDPSIVITEIDGLPVYDSEMDEDIRYNESGQSFFSVNAVGVYRPVAKLKRMDHEFQFYFNNAKQSPIALYRIILAQ